MTKAFVIHLDENKTSVKTAKWAVESSVKHGLGAQLFSGITPDTLHKWESKYKLEKDVMKPSHMYDRQIGKNGSNFTYQCKYSNFLNHYTLWHECLELDKTIVILEHDVLCIRNWDTPSFNELLVLNIHSGLYNPEFEKLQKPNLHTGIHNYENKFLDYKSKNLWQGAGMIPGSAAYAVSPRGATRLIENVKLHGWDKADYIINTKSVHMEYAMPDYYQFSHHLISNQRTSHGE